jgi:hypothetical protein
MGREVERLDPDVNLALRELAGWPLHTAQHDIRRERHRTVTVQRDHLGRVVGSVEQIEEHEHESYTEGWGR